jgi:hypothetical protein
MIVLLAILAWIFLISLTVCMCVVAQQGDLAQSSNGYQAVHPDRVEAMTLAGRDPKDGDEPWPGDPRRADRPAIAVE